MPALHGVARLDAHICNDLRQAAFAYFDVIERGLDDPVQHQMILQMAETLASAAMRGLVQSYPCQFEKPTPCRQREIVGQAEDYSRSHQDISVKIEDLCRFLAISERTLFYAFAETTGMSPVSWLRLQKLNRARKALRTADPEQTMVKQVALAQGFLHLGRFSVNYKHLFGETPSETLRR